ncbi:hypothetical protein AURDEDRAFT_133384 [Auricularia subglabra TFB-10046 SS5]|nr:hypothetical protein AURDEDRAFT_133384 [Auricularia subglabra TFB-10046 SS5]
MYAAYGVLALLSLPGSTALAAASPQAPSVARGYNAPHSYGRSFTFDRHDGWEKMDVTNEQYKYGNATNVESVVPRSRKAKAKAGAKGFGFHALDSAWNNLKGIGKSTSVLITWYTGHDLINPSCWSNSGWAPTDESFACALTLTGWTTKPKCFSFLEICNGSTKCIFVRVVDTCAGCKAGSKHVDLTKAAFAALADLDVGILNVQMRPATQPKTWREDLWGPREA